MTNPDNSKYPYYRKVVWGLYALAALVVIILLVAFVAQDNEERLFYSLMTAAAAYVFRPTERFIARKVLQLFGVAAPADSNKSE